MKQRFDSLDVLAMVAHLQRTILGRRVVNIYDGDTADTYIFKLDGDPKVFLCLQSGIRFHDFDSFNADGTMPSPFCSKLRKHLRGLRLEQVKQVGTDRVVLFSFLGGNAGKHSIILELYAKGNLILTDADYSIVALLRSHVYDDKTKAQDEEKVAVKVGTVYPVTYAADIKDLAANTQQPEGILSEDPASWAKEILDMPTKKPLTLKTLLLRATSGVSQYGPALLEHCILFAKLPPHDPLKNLEMSAEQWQTLQKALREEAPAVLDRLTQTSSTDTPGYLIYDKTEKNSETDNNLTLATPILAKYPDKILLEFQPHILLQHADRPHLQTPNFGSAVTDFFGQLQTQKAMIRAQAVSKSAQSKLEKARQDQQDRLEALEQEQLDLFRQAKAVERQAETVDQALAIINSALNSGMDWDQLEEIVQVEQENQNPIALLIKALRLQDDVMRLRLPVDPHMDPDGESVMVDILLKETAHANASRLFAKYRSSKEKAQKTIEAADKALQAAEETAKRQLVDANQKARPTTGLIKRKPFWFEKFHWFITSDNYLVVGGKDAHQNETLVKRYLRPGDAYLHADVHGASSCILRAKRRRTKSGKTVPIPLSEQALREAGNFTICHSSAWTSRMVTSAWWVESHQVSKTAPSGEYLTVGSFMIRGKKNFLPPSQLEMGLAVLFRLADDDSIARHQNERRDFALMALGDQDSDDEDTSIDAPMSNKNGKEVSHQVSASSVDTGKGSKAMELDDVDGSDEEDESSGKNGSSGLVTRKAKKGLSTRDRKLIKKYGSLEEAEKVLASRAADDDNGSTPSASVATSSNTPAQQSSKRGKKAKMKRAKKKYADQDEEDRELAMMLLQGTSKKDKRKENNKKLNEQSETQQQVAAETSAVLKKDVSKLVQGLNEDVRSCLADCVQTEDSTGTIAHDWQNIDFDIIEQLLSLQPDEAQLAAAKRLRSLVLGKNIENLSLSLAGIIRTIRKHGHEDLEKRAEEEQDTQATNESSKKQTESKDMDASEPAELDMDDDVGDDTAELSKLTGKPTADDSISFAMPVFAPYHTLSQYSFRVKLTPGSMKRGKAAKAGIEMLLASAGQVPHGKRVRDMIKSVSDNDWIQTLISDVKISSAGASKVTKQQKAKVKKNKKGK